jgi:hypothetical protein
VMPTRIYQALKFGKADRWFAEAGGG